MKKRFLAFIFYLDFNQIPFLWSSSMSVDIKQCGAVRSGRSRSNLNVDGLGFLDRGDSREAHSCLLMRLDETFTHIPGQSPGLQFATLLPAVQTNKASHTGPPGPCQAKPGQTAHL